jgi:predicted Zn-dependent protease with MMP-like domain
MQSERDPSDAALAEQLAEIEAQIAEDPAAAMAALERLGDVADSLEGRYLRATATWATTGAEAAEVLLKGLIVEDPGFADAHYALAGVYEDLEDHESMVRHFLAVLALDAADDQARELVGEAEEEQIVAAAEGALDALPEELKQRLGNVAVVVETRPHWDVVGDGFDPRALGMFEGPDDFGQRILELAPMTSRIVLFTANLVASFADPEDLEEEVRVTVLHEVGHYFGLDEDGVAALGLE